MTNPLKVIFVSVLSVFGFRTEPQPSFILVDEVADVEIRRYAPRLAAETTVNGADENAARSEAFRILAAYIFGNNHQKREIAMTAPVETNAAQQIAMTAPVETSKTEGAQMTMRFYMPTDVTLANAPVPNDDRVRLIEIPEQTVAALRFSGSWTVEAIATKQQELIAKLTASPWATVGATFALFYDPPFTLAPLRRNEAAVVVRPRS